MRIMCARSSSASNELQQFRPEKRSFGEEDPASPSLRRSKRICARSSSASNELHLAQVEGEKAEFEALHLAIKQGLPLSQIRLTIRKYLTYIERPTKSGTPLILAIKRGDFQLVKCLMKNRCSLETCCSGRDTPLQYAIRASNVKIIKTLIDNGVNCERAGSEGITPLIEAIQTKNIAIIELIIGSVIDLNAAQWSGETALISAVKTRQLSIAQLLVTRGADLDISDLKHRTALHHAVLNNDPDMAIIRYLIDSGANLSLKDDKGRSPLVYATRLDYHSLVRLLIEKGANCHDSDLKQKGLLHHAALKSQWLFSFLLSQDLDMSKIDSKGRTPLHLAAKAKYSDTAKALINNGADIMAKDFCGRTPLHCAILLKRRGCCEILIENGADVLAVDSEGRTPMHYSLSYLTSCSFRGSIFSSLLEKVTNLDSLDSLDTDGQTLLSHALEIRDMSIFENLIRKGVNVNIQNSDGLAPLHLASKRRNVMAIDLLTAENVDLFIDVQDNMGNTALDYAMSDPERSKSGLLRALLRAGASTTYLTPVQMNEIEQIVCLDRNC